MNLSDIPKTIWMYWAQGEENLPFMVKQCALSWRTHNPGWKFVLLDKDTLSELIDLEGLDTRSDIGLQALSDIIRVKLLSHYGGIWVDASLFCARPLDDWLYPVIDDNFFAFSSKKKDRLMTTWFLAGNSESKILTVWAKEISNFWHSNSFKPMNYSTKQVLRKLTSLRKRRIVSNNIWFSKFVLQFLKTYPYPVNMYLFERILDNDRSLNDLWSNRNILYDAPAEHLQNNLGINSKTTLDSISFLTSNATPVHKLNWRQDLGYAKKDTNFHYLIKHTNLP